MNAKGAPEMLKKITRFDMGRNTGCSDFIDPHCKGTIVYDASRAIPTDEVVA